MQTIFQWGKQSFMQWSVFSTVFRNALREKLDCLMHGNLGPSATLHVPQGSTGIAERTLSPSWPLLGSLRQVSLHLQVSI